MKPGYKQTEVGVIPVEWEIRRLVQICTKITDGTHDTPTPVRSGVPFLTAIHIKENFIDYEACLFLTEKDHRLIFARCNPKRGDILMVNIGAGVATTAFVDVEFEFSLKNVALLKPDAFSTSGQYLNQCLIKIKPSISFALSSGGAQPFLSLSQIGLIAIPLPPLPEQRAIATALSDVDALLGGLDRLIAKKRDLKQAAMQQLLTGQTRLPGFQGEWEVRRIGNFTDCTAGGTPSTSVPSFWGGQIRWMSSGELNLKRVEEVEGRITEAGLNNSSTKMIPKKCVLIGLAGQGKTRGTVAMNFVELSTNQSIAAIFPSPAFIPEYLYFNLDSRYEELRELSAGDGGRGGLNLRIIKAISVPFPTLPEQTAIATVLSEMDGELAVMEQRREKTRALKQGMMQELLTGRTRLV